MNSYKKNNRKPHGKPRWNSAPEWAQWLAQDEDGTWCWYAKKPIADKILQVWEAEVDDFIDATHGAHNFAWTTTLEKKPS